MKKRQPSNWTFQDVLDSYAFVVCNLPQYITEVKSNGPRKMNFKVVVVLVLHDIVLIKL